MKNLLNNEKLLGSGVVANNRMNRARGITGANSYRRDLSFDPLEFIRQRLASKKSAAWLDVCCGEGRAPIEAALFFAGIEREKQFCDSLHIVGIDLAGMFRPVPSELNCLTLLETSIEDFAPARKFDLITCVHGLHYVGDKLSAIRNAATWLEDDGVFVANFDVKSLKLVDETKPGEIFSDFLKKQGFDLDRRKRLLRLQGSRAFDLPFEYVGADDRAGPNYTGQPAVDSYYQLISA